MRFKILLVIFISLMLHNRLEAAEYGPAFGQEKFGERLFQEIMHGDTASVTPFFEDSVRPNLTKPVLEHIQGQINWLAKFMGDNLEQITSGFQPLDSTGKQKAFYREYRLAAESNKRAPLIVMHVWFADSVTLKAAGAFVKSFVDNGEKRIAGPQSWDIGGKHIDVNAVILVQTSKGGGMLAIETFDDDTVKIDSTYIRTRGVLIVRKAIAEGFLDSARATIEGKTLSQDVGVAVIRRSPDFGIEKLKFGIKAKEYMTPEEFKKAEASKKAEESKESKDSKKPSTSPTAKPKAALKKKSQSAP